MQKKKLYNINQQRRRNKKREMRITDQTFPIETAKIKLKIDSQNKITKNKSEISFEHFVPYFCCSGISQKWRQQKF